MILTEKETTAIKDLQTQEQSCIEKYNRYGKEAKDKNYFPFHVILLYRCFKGENFLSDFYSKIVFV